MPTNIFTIAIPKKSIESSYVTKITRSFTMESGFSGFIAVPVARNSRVSITGTIQYRVRNSNEGGTIRFILYELTGDINGGNPMETINKYDIYGDGTLVYSTFIYDDQNAGMTFQNITGEYMQITLNLDISVGFSRA